MIALMVVFSDSFKFFSKLNSELRVTSSNEQFSRQLWAVTNGNIHSDFPIRGSRQRCFQTWIGESWEVGTVFIATPEGKTYSVEHPPVPEDYRFDSGFMSHGNLVLIGHTGGNSISHGISILRRQGREWKQIQFQDERFESWDDVKFSRQGSKLVAEISGTTYPKNFNTSHSNANVAMRRRFVLSSGILEPTKDVHVSSPMGVLDDCLSADKVHNSDSLTKFCANRVIVRKLKLVLPELLHARMECDFEKVARKKHAVLWAVTQNLRFDFVRNRGLWRVSDIRHEKAIY